MTNDLQKTSNQMPEKAENKMLKIILVVVLGVLILALLSYSIYFLVTEKSLFSTKNYVNLKKDKKIEENVNKVVENTEEEKTNVNTNINEDVDITKDWLKFDKEGISFLYPDVLESTKKKREVESFSGQKHAFYDFGVFGVGIIDNSENLDLQQIIRREYDPESLLTGDDFNDFITTKIGKNNQISALSISIVDEEKSNEYFEKYGPLGIRYFIAGKGKIYTISGGQAFPNKEAEEYYTKNNIKNLDDMVKTIEIEN